MVSIIIINYNTFQLTVDCINSITLHTECDYEIILVDNASTECDPQKFLEIFPSITLIKSPINCGFSKGNNLGIEKSNSEYILLLNSDTLLINNAIDLALEKIKSNKDIGALTAQLVSVDGSLQQASFELPSMLKLLGCTLKLHYISDKFRHTQPDMEKEHYSKFLWGTFFLFPREILKIFNDTKLPETFFMYAEDGEWCYYINKANYKLLYYPDAKILHYGGASSNNHNIGLLEKWKQSFANQYRLQLIMHGKFHTIIYFICLAFFNFSHFKKNSFLQGLYILKYLFGFNILQKN